MGFSENEGVWRSLDSPQENRSRSLHWPAHAAYIAGMSAIEDGCTGVGLQGLQVVLQFFVADLRMQVASGTVQLNEVAIAPRSERAASYGFRYDVQDHSALGGAAIRTSEIRTMSVIPLASTLGGGKPTFPTSSMPGQHLDRYS